MFIGSRTLANRLQYDVTLPDEATILRFAGQALERPSDSGWHDDDLWETHTLMFHSAPDSDDLIAQSNTATILRDLGEAYARFPGAVESAGFGHWTYSHFDTIKVRVLYSNGEIHPAFADAVAIALALEDYPLWDEEDHSERETEEWNRAILEAIDYASRDADEPWSDIKRERVQDLLWETCPGYYDLSWIPEEEMMKAEATADSEIAATVSAGLPERLAGGDYYSSPLPL